MDLVTVAAELYGLTPDRFTVTRNARAAEAKRGGDTELSAGIKGMRKPSASAWVVNLLVRERPDAIEEALALGDALRDAQADLDAAELRTLSRERSRLIGAIARDGASLAADLGHPVSESVLREVQQTLQAAMADPGAAAAVRTGCLVRDLSSNGVDPADLTDAVAIPLEPAPAEERSPRKASSAKTAASGAEAAARKNGAAEKDRDRRKEEAAERKAEQARRKKEAEEAKRRAEQARIQREKLDDQLRELASRRKELQSERRRWEQHVRNLADELLSLDREITQVEREREKVSGGVTGSAVKRR